MGTRRPRPAPVPRFVFTGFRFPPDVIVVAVRWYPRLGLSYRDVEELLTERGVELAVAFDELAMVIRGQTEIALAVAALILVPAAVAAFRARTK